MRRAAASAFALSLALLVTCGSLPVLAADSLAGLEKLAGTWARNLDLSDDAAEAVKEHPVHPPFIGPGTPGGPMSGPGVSGPLIGGTGRYGRTDPAELERSRALMHFATDVPDEMMISVDGNVVTITSRNGHVTHLTADGKKTPDVTDSGFEILRRTKWDDGALVTEFKAKGGEGKQVYKRSGSRLTLQVVFDGDAATRTVKVKHVYESRQP